MSKEAFYNATLEFPYRKRNSGITWVKFRKWTNSKMFSIVNLILLQIWIQSFHLAISLLTSNKNINNSRDLEIFEVII
jgi:hypothetical protein